MEQELFNQLLSRRAEGKKVRGGWLKVQARRIVREHNKDAMSEKDQQAFKASDGALLIFIPPHSY